MNQKKIYTLHAHGMHCSACMLLIETELLEHTRVVSAKPSLTTRSVEICGDFGNKTLVEIAQELTELLSEHSLSTEPEKKKVNWKEFAFALPIALGFLLFFVLLQKLGIVNLVSSNEVNYGSAFIIGIIASLSTCMAVVGGLLLSLSANFAKQGDTVRPQTLFHAGRIVSFFILGGVIGAIGSIFQIGSFGTFVLGVTVGIIMLILGVNLLDIFHFTKKLQLSLPQSLSRKMLGIAKINHTLIPAIVGMSTFFLPCGFTQSMQIYTLSTGSFLRGGLTMLLFALGTFPVLALISFSSMNIRKSSKAGIFWKSAGLIVILFALLNIINSFVALGWISPIFNF